MKPNFSVSNQSSSNPANRLWNHGTENDWLNALENYNKIIETRSYEARSLEMFMNQLQAKDVEKMSVEEFYNFLHDKYFVWKFTQKNRLANCRKYLRRYVEQNRMNELANIQRRLFSTNLSDIAECLSTAMEILGLGPSGGSGLLSILFPSYFGTVDRFVVESLQKIDGINYEHKLSKMNPENLKPEDGVFIVKIFREKAKELNAKFNTDFWTPRKIDMVLWAYGR